nr:hypothetical protein [Tanacetum cinerariifolium]
MDTEVAKCSVDKKYFEIKKKELCFDNDCLLEHLICQDVMNVVMHADVHNVLSLNTNFLGNDNLALEHVANLKGKNDFESIQNVHNENVVTSKVYKLDLEPLSPCIKTNRDAYVDYLKVTQEYSDTLRGIVEQARALKSLDNALEYGSRDENLYIISLDDMLKSSPLAKQGLVRGIPKLKFKKDHICSACSIGKSKKTSRKPKAVNTNLRNYDPKGEDKFVHDPNETSDSSQRPPHDCLKCGNPDPNENSSQSPPHINHHGCYRCGNSLDDIIISEHPPCIAITPVLSTKETKDSLIMGDEHLETIPKKESDEFIKSSVKNLVPNASESEDLSNIRHECDVPVYDDFITFSNLHFDVDDDFSSKSLLNQDSSIISSSKIDSLLDEFAGELNFLKSLPLRIDEAYCDPEEEIPFIKKLLHDNSCPRPPKEYNLENSDAVIKSFSLSPIPVDDSNSLMKEIDLSLTPDDSMPLGIEDDDYDSEGDILILEEFLRNDSLSFPKNNSFHFDFPLSPRPPPKPPDDEIELD